MDTIKKLFPYSFKEKNTVKDLIIAILIYLAITIVCSIVTTILGGIPLIGALIGLLSSLIGIYTFIGIVLAVLDYMKVFK